MKVLFEKFVRTLDGYAEDSRSVIKRAIQEQAIKAVKLDLANDLKLHLNTIYLNQDEISYADYDKLLEIIEDIQKEVGEKRDGRKIEAGYFDALLVWMTDRLNAAKAQTANALNDDNLPLSDTQKLIRDKCDEFIVLLGGFANFPDNRNAFERWSKHHPRVAIYAPEDNWNDAVLSSEEEIKVVAEKVEALKQATVFQLRNQADDQMKLTLHYMTVAELKKISPALDPLAQFLTEKFDLKPLVLEKDKLQVQLEEQPVDLVQKPVEEPAVVDQKPEEAVDNLQSVKHQELPVQMENEPLESKKLEPAILSNSPANAMANAIIFSNLGVSKKSGANKTFSEVAHVKQQKETQGDRKKSGMRSNH